MTSPNSMQTGSVVRPRLAALSTGLDELGCEALLVLAGSAQDSDLAPFLAASVHMGECLLAVPRGEEPRLAYLTPMEREEAAATGLALLTPEELEVLRWTREHPEPAPFLAQVIGRALDLCGLDPDASPSPVTAPPGPFRVPAPG